LDVPLVHPVYGPVSESALLEKMNSQRFHDYSSSEELDSLFPKFFVIFKEGQKSYSSVEVSNYVLRHKFFLGYLVLGCCV
jgi:hypothetical protein